MKMRETILRLFHEILESSGGTAKGQLTDDTVLLQSGMDSLGFAVLVARLEEETGCDPFSASTEAYYPRTLGEFVRFYEENCG